MVVSTVVIAPTVAAGPGAGIDLDQTFQRWKVFFPGDVTAHFQSLRDPGNRQLRDGGTSGRLNLFQQRICP